MKDVLRFVPAGNEKVAAADQLTVYDAAYLELAERTSLPLATLDGELRKAALAAGVVLLAT